MSNTVFTGLAPFKGGLGEGRGAGEGTGGGGWVGGGGLKQS